MIKMTEWPMFHMKSNGVTEKEKCHISKTKSKQNFNSLLNFGRIEC